MSVSVPQGLSGAAAIALVQSYTNEPNLPSTATILSFLNRGVEQVVARIGGIRLWAPYYTVNEQTTVQLNDDVLEIISANFSMGNAAYNNTGSSSPFAQGALVYPMTQLEQAQFMDAAAGFPAVGFGPPQAYFLYQDQGYAPSSPLPAPPQAILSSVSGTSNGDEVEVVTTYVNANGETTESEPADFTPEANEQVQVGSPPSYTNATDYNIYAGAVGGPYYLQNASPIAIGTPYVLPGTIVTDTANPPTENTAIGSGQGGAQSMQLYPSAMIGQVNIYYKARPLLWSDTSDTSYTNLDTSAQEAVVLFAVMRTLMARGRGDEITPWKIEYEGQDGNGGMIANLKDSINRRMVPRSGQVRDVRDRSFPSVPYWLSSP